MSAVDFKHFIIEMVSSELPSGLPGYQAGYRATKRATGLPSGLPVGLPSGLPVGLPKTIIFIVFGRHGLRKRYDLNGFKRATGQKP